MRINSPEMAAMDKIIETLICLGVPIHDEARPMSIGYMEPADVARHQLGDALAAARTEQRWLRFTVRNKVIVFDSAERTQKMAALEATIALGEKALSAAADNIDAALK